ncbi:hypothetical protein [Paenibacillus graminis]|uniref:hypothetical protein n=1 Tax=Paenibacillus graminis TaxID=189425 RepID=UPI002DBE6726|nr:hypothetical protein [Paenibacillus graminis]MEC0171651.1 hypothetical protein [Paenibacillus graminis]
MGLLFFASFSLILLLLVDPNGYHAINPRSFSGTHGHQLMWQDMQFMEGVVGQVGLRIALVD